MRIYHCKTLSSQLKFLEFFDLDFPAEQRGPKVYYNFLFLLFKTAWSSLSHQIAVNSAVVLIRFLVEVRKSTKPKKKHKTDKTSKRVYQSSKRVDKSSRETKKSSKDEVRFNLFEMF